MITLKEFVNTSSEMSDLEIIKQWIVFNHMEAEMVAMVPKLAESSLNRQKRELDYIKSWSPYLVTTYETDGVSLEAVKYFNHLFQCVVCGVEPDDTVIKWLEENVPNMERPTFFFVPALAWLADKGIRFKNYDREFKDYDRRPKF